MSAGSVRNQASVSLRGAAERPERQAGGRSPCAFARRLAPAVSPSAGIHTGMSDHALTFCCSRKAVGTQTGFADEPMPSRNALDHRLHRQRRGRTHRVEGTEGARLRHPDRPLGEVARVDELHGVAAVARREHVAAAVEPDRPVGEAVALVARTDDQARDG